MKDESVLRRLDGITIRLRTVAAGLSAFHAGNALIIEDIAKRIDEILEDLHSRFHIVDREGQAEEDRTLRLTEGQKHRLETHLSQHSPQAARLVYAAFSIAREVEKDPEGWACVETENEIDYPEYLRRKDDLKRRM